MNALNGIPFKVRSRYSDLTPDHITNAFIRTGGNTKMAAEVLNVAQSTLYTRVKAYGMDLKELRRVATEATKGRAQEYVEEAGGARGWDEDTDTKPEQGELLELGPTEPRPEPEPWPQWQPIAPASVVVSVAAPAPTAYTLTVDDYLFLLNLIMGLQDHYASMLNLTLGLQDQVDFQDRVIATLTRELESRCQP